MSDVELALWICGGVIVLWILVKLCSKGRSGRGGFDPSDIFDILD